MKRLIHTLFAVVVLFNQALGQSVTPFDIYGYPKRFGPKTNEYYKANGFKYVALLTHSAIYDNDPNKFSTSKVDNWLAKNFPDASATGSLVIDWETQVFKDLRDYPVTDSRFKYAESQFIGLVNHVKRKRPNVKVGIYGIPFKVWSDEQKVNYNLQYKYLSILSKTDFLAPSFYIMYADEEVGHIRNMQYLKDNLNIALDYSERLKKPVIPFVWQKIHDYNKTYGREIIQKDVFVEYIKCIANYSRNNYKVSGIIWWDEFKESKRLEDLSGINNHLDGKLTGSNNAEKYDNLMLDYAKALVQMLYSNSTVPSSSPVSTSGSPTN